MEAASLAAESLREEEAGIPDLEAVGQDGLEEAACHLAEEGNCPAVEIGLEVGNCRVVGRSLGSRSFFQSVSCL